MIRLLIFAALFYFCYRLLKGPIGSMLKDKLKPSDEEDSSLADAELIKDPQCGAYFMKQKGIEARVEGKTLHFCSRECRDKFLESRR